MDVQNAERNYKNALFAYNTELGLFMALTRQDTEKTIERTIRDLKNAWGRMKAAHVGLVDAKLESLGR